MGTFILVVDAFWWLKWVSRLMCSDCSNDLHAFNADDGPGCFNAMVGVPVSSHGRSLFKESGGGPMLLARRSLPQSSSSGLPFIGISRRPVLAV
jgi:hypothetical protein